MYEKADTYTIQVHERPALSIDSSVQYDWLALYVPKHSLITTKI